MKICHILNKVTDCGNGIISSLVDLACEQSRQGHEVVVLSAGGEFIELLNQHGVEHRALDQTHSPVKILKAMILCHRLLKSIKPDIVHAHMMTGVVLMRAVKPLHRFRLVSTVHNEWQRSAILMGLADRVIAVSEEVARAMRKRGISANKIRVVRNGTVGSVRAKLPGSGSNLSLQRPSITTIAGLFHRKGISCLIRAFEQVRQQCPEAHLYIVGDGPDKGEFLRQTLQSPARDAIHFEGFSARPNHYLQQTDVFVLASIKEPFGLVLSEARFAGCAVVGSEVGGIPEVLEQGTAGQLFPVNDDQKLAQILVELVSNQNTLAQWKQKAKRNLQWLSLERVCQETSQVYAQI